MEAPANQPDNKPGGKNPPPAEYRWKKGQSGNPKGRPKKYAWLKKAEATVTKNEDLQQALADELIGIAKGLKGTTKDQIRALEMLEDRISGPVVRQIQAEIELPDHSITLVDRGKGDASK